MTVDAACQKLGQDLRRRGAIVLAVFALVWAAAGASGVASGGPAPTVIGVAAVALTAATVALAFRYGTLARAVRRRRLPMRWNQGLALVNIAQVVAIILAVSVLNRLGSVVFIPPVTCLIVGAHFVPLARLVDQPQYWWTAGLLAAVGVLGFLAYAAGADAELARAVVGLGAALVLWGSSVHVSARG